MMASLIDSLGTQVVHVLAVAGGAAVGWVLAGLATRLLGRLVSQRPVPRPALLLVRLLGATALGLAVYLLIFGSGGSGWGIGGAGWGIGGNGKQGKDAATQGPTGREPPASAPRPSARENLTPPASDTLRVHIIPSKRYSERMDQRFYRIEGETEYRTLPDVAERIEQHRSKDPALNVVEIITYRNSIAEREGLVTKLVQRLQQPGLTVKTYEVAADAP
jgi:pimeloyl-ACP methyl ester carboxylesterase